MIATWMLYTTVVGLLATVAALGLERAGRALRIQVRFVWVAAIATTLLWPVVINGRSVHPRRMPPSPAPGAEVSGGLPVLPTTNISARPGWRDRLTTMLAIGDRFDPWLLGLWGLGSLFILTQLVRSIDAIRRGRKVWKTRIVDGALVLMSNDLGPAVIGVRDPRIVLPQWTLSLEPPLRAVILRHEEEHRRARDPWLLLGAIVATAIAPWNAAVWWQCKRLRLAIETDCDARVLERDQDVERYGSLLVTIAERRGPQTPAVAAALTESISNLERRITIMTTPSPRFPRTTAAVLAAIAAGVMVVAAVTPVPVGLAAFAQSRAIPAVPLSTPEPAIPATLVAEPVRTPAQRASHAELDQPGLGHSDSDGGSSAAATGAAPGVADSTARVTHTTVDTMAPPSAVVAPSSAQASAAVARRANILIRGTVTGPDDGPLENVAVTATTPSSESRTAKSGKDGRFTLMVPESDGIYLVSFAAAGFAPTFVQVMRSIPNAVVLIANAKLDPAVPVVSDTSHTVASAPAMDSVRTLGMARGPGAVRRFPPATVDTTPVSKPADGFFDFQVTQQARPAAGRPPDYPAELRKANVEGAVTAQFVVNADGTPDIATFKVIKTTHPLFTEAVKQALPGMTFIPAMVGNQPVKQLMQMPFVFTLSK